MTYVNKSRQLSIGCCAAVHESVLRVPPYIVIRDPLKRDELTLIPDFQRDIKLSPISLHRSNDTIEFSVVGHQG